jgi:chemosensory pili system protein ChpA (sensor histidine kinase/response regulator)
MGDPHDYVALEWVKGEITETLKQARHALEAFVENLLDTTRMRSCLTYVHQVHGTLQMVEFYGAALLAEEMEQLAQALLEGSASNQEEALEVLMQAILQLPVYLDRIQSARCDLPMVVLPLLNDLRAARGEKLLSETSLFSPDMPAPRMALSSESLAQLGGAQLPALLRKLRQMLQMALVGVLRNQQLTTNLEHMARVFARLEVLCKEAPLGPLWSIAAGVIEGLTNGSVANSPSVRSLLHQVDKELKRLVEQGVEAINQAAPADLSKNLLFYVAKSTAQSPRILALKAQYRLDEALPDARLVDEERAHLAGPDRDAMRSVVTALCEELVRVKDSLDLFVRSNRQQVSELEALLVPLKQIADTLAVLGFGQPRKIILDQVEILRGLALGRGEVNDAVLMDMAGALLYVEATLTGMVGQVEGRDREESYLPTTDMAQIHRLVIKEARNGLEQAKDAIIEFIASQWNHEHLARVPELLIQTRGALAMIPLTRAAALLHACNRYIQEQLLARKTVPDWHNLDTLADAITSVEYYLERLSEDQGTQGELILDVAEQSLQTLGYPLQEKPPILDVLEPPDTSDLSNQAEQTDALVADAPVEEEPVQEDPVDEELLEVFIEEVGEVLESLGVCLPQWCNSLNKAEKAQKGENKAALMEVRRAFHTLKGSGRMVRALVIGELGWAIENLLNRVLEHSVQPDAEVQQTVYQALALMPVLLEEFAAKAQQQRADVDALVATAQALALGQRLPTAQTDSAPAVATPEPADPMAASAAVAADQDVIDPQLREIFRNEAQTHLDALVNFLGDCAQALPQAVTDDLQRALHTLKGSAYMAGILPVAEIAAPLEKMVKEFKANLLDMDLSDAQLLGRAEQLLRVGLAQLDSQPLAPIAGAAELLEGIQRHHFERLESAEQARQAASGENRDPQLIGIFLTEGMDILLDAETLLTRWRAHPAEDQQLNALLDELTILGRGAEMADLPQIDDLCQALLDLYSAVQDGHLAADEGFFEAVHSAHEALIGMLDQVAAGLQVTAQPEQVDALQALLQAPAHPAVPSTLAKAMPPVEVDGPGGLDEEVLAIFLEEAVDLLHSSAQALQRWLGEPAQQHALLSLQRDLHTLKGGARMAGIKSIGDLAHELESLYEGLVDNRYSASPALGDLLQQSHDRLAVLLEQLQANQPLAEPTDLLEAIAALRHGAAPAVTQPTAVEVPAALAAAPYPPALEPERDQELADIFLEEGFDIVDSSSAALQRWMQDSQNSRELESLQRDLHTLKGGARMVEIAEIGDLAHELESLYERLGAGRLSASPPLFELLNGSHDRLAEMLEAVRDGHRTPSGEDLIETIRSFRANPEQPLRMPCCAAPSSAAKPPAPLADTDTDADPREVAAATAVEAVTRAVEGAGKFPLVRNETGLELLSELPSRLLSPIVAASVLPAEARVATLLPFVRKAQEAAQRAAAQRAPQELARVPATLLEDLVNLAGETSIFRGRVEQQVSDFGFTLGEMEATLERVRDQLRRLDIETQSQILSRYQAEAERAGYEDFDPLEMDRHSQVQQLSRALFESASDLLELKETLVARSRDAQTLLLQQARVNTELQEGLMRTRMVPFERLVPRLRRIVRQVASELGKQVEFSVGNAEGEMDRTVLERLMAPLEHMLRNAVDHGIESGEERSAAGKPAQGRIRLEIGREGGDIALSISDDGGGIRREAVRRKAIERGLLNEHAVLSEHEILQFILEPGFSTAQQVTQISGRGVGLDVVHAEVKQLGGVMSIESTPGQGSCFRVRLPFTVSVNRALMVKSGEDLYAIPLNTIEGIVRVSPYELEALYEQNGTDRGQGEAPRFEYAGQSYELRYLGDLLNNGQQPKLIGQSLPLPVILVRSNEHAVAVQVDSLAGSREIVVKSLGPQFAGVHGVSGATILGDGRVVIILDLLATIRELHAHLLTRLQPSLASQAQMAAEVEAQRPTLVMVVDDSVTVRKVTSRLLERNGMNVLTAKDGVDAISLLQEHKPDIMLLDIEMPRMDGYEVATLVRHDERLKDLPIIMITSRTGAKHRERAMSLGVNEYLGKPYQEALLLERIAQLVNRPQLERR